MQKAEGRRQNGGIRLKGRAAAARVIEFTGRFSFFKGQGLIASGRQGFTLIEVLIAITVFSVGILAVAAMQSHSTSTNARAMAITHASTLAAEKVEELEYLDANGVDLTPGAHTPATNPPGFNLSWQVTDNTPIPGAKQIVVTVQSTSGPATTTNLTYNKIRTY